MENYSASFAYEAFGDRGSFSIEVCSRLLFGVKLGWDWCYQSMTGLQCPNCNYTPTWEGRGSNDGDPSFGAIMKRENIFGDVVQGICQPARTGSDCEYHRWRFGEERGVCVIGEVYLSYAKIRGIGHLAPPAYGHPADLTAYQAWMVTLVSMVIIKMN